MATFVLVHGSSHGGWCWKKVTPLLSKDGHEVYTPTLTGLGERSHLVSKDIGLDTHILDIIQVLEYEGLNKVILVGHSYGGLVIGGVAEKVPERIRRLVYLDAYIPQDNKSAFDEKDMHSLDKLKDDVMDDYAKGKISEQHYNNLNNTISVLYEEIYKKQIDSLNGKNSNGILLNSVKENVKDGYAKIQQLLQQKEVQLRLINKRLQKALAVEK